VTLCGHPCLGALNGLNDFADRCLTTWLPRRESEVKYYGRYCWTRIPPAESGLTDSNHVARLDRANGKEDVRDDGQKCR
jgi:hypothetical protein